MAERVARSDLEVNRRELEAAIDHQALRLTVRLGLVLAAAVAIIGALTRL